MSIVSFKPIHDGRDGEKEGRVHRYTRVFRAKTDDPYDESPVIEADPRCPRIGSQYPWNTLATCQRVRSRNEGFSKTVWIVTASYSTEREVSEKPEEERAHIEWNTESYDRPYFKDRDGKAILNSAGCYYDPPVRGDDSRWVVTISKNVLAVPKWILDYRDALNASPIAIQGVEIAAKCAKMMAIRIGDWQERNDIAYLPFSMTIALSNEGWDKEELDQGFYERDSEGKKTRIKDDKQKDCCTPQLLDGKGKRLVDPTPDNAKFNKHPIYNLRDFSKLPLR